MPLGFRAPHPFPTPRGSGSWRKVGCCSSKNISITWGSFLKHSRAQATPEPRAQRPRGWESGGLGSCPGGFNTAPSIPQEPWGGVWPSDLGDQWEGLRNESLGENRREEPVVGGWLWQWREAGGMNRGIGERTGGWGVDRSWPRRGQARDQGKRRRGQHHQGVWLWTLGTREHLQEGTRERGQVWKQT